MSGERHTIAAGLIVLGALCLACTACGSSAQECTAIATWSFRVRVTDSKTGASICDATLIASDGSKDTTLTSVGGADCLYVGVTEQLGTFRVTATKAGYQTGMTSIVVDQSDGCHVVTQDGGVTLEPQ